MSLSIYRNKVERLTKELADVDKRLALEREKLSALNKEIARILESLQRTKSKQQIGTKQNRLHSKQAKQLRIEKNIVQLQKKKSEIITDLNRALDQLSKAEDRELKKKEYEDRKRRRAELDHIRKISHEYQKQSELNKALSQQQYVIDLSKLPEKIAVLFLASNPHDNESTPLRLDQEIREITDRIRASEYRDSIQLISRWAVRSSDILQALNEHKPHIVHFSGHGSPSGEIVLETAEGTPKPVSKEAITSTMKTMSDNIRLIVFNSCFSSGQAEAVTQYVDAAIGMKDAISDEAAKIFSAQLYSSIGFGHSLQKAFDQAISALLLEGIPEDDTPELYVKDGLDANQIIFVRP